MALPTRLRVSTAAGLVTVVGLGLLSRRYPLPGFLAEYTSDALYAVALFFALAFVAPAVPSRLLAASAFLLCSAIETAQLLPWQWLVALRSSRLGAMFLGQGFQGADVLAYAVGTGVAACIDVWRCRPSRPSRPPAP